MTPQEAFERCSAEVDPDCEYTPPQAARLLGLHPHHLIRHWHPHKLPARLVRVGISPKARRYLVKGSDVLAFARWRAAQVDPHAGVIAKARSNNAKLGGAAVTIVARQSCPESCPFRGEGCYAEHDNNRQHWDRISAGAAGRSPLELARSEAEAIDALPAERDLRLHVAGDSTTEEGTRLVAEACGRYVARGAALGRTVKVWCYTHAWRQVPRDAWGLVSVLASCESAADAREARARGYAAALVVPEFEGEKAYMTGGATVLPCPAQTRGRSCTQCRLCFDDARLLGRGLVIGFALHGAGSNKARLALGRRRSLPVIRRAA